MTGSVAFHDLPAESFPFTVRFYRDGHEVHRIDVSGPGAIAVPALGPGVRSLFEFADGDVVEVEP